MTDTIHRAAAIALCKSSGFLSVEELRALPAAQVAVKPLEWVYHGTVGATWAATASFGAYVIIDLGGNWNADRFVLRLDQMRVDHFATADAAKAAAQADYETRIRSALTVAPAQVADPAQIRDAGVVLDKNGDLIGSPLEYELRRAWRLVAKHHGLPNDGVVEADMVRSFLSLIDNPPAPASDVSSFASTAVTTPSEPGRMAEGDTSVHTQSDRLVTLLAQAKPCPRCGNAELQIDLGLSDHHFPEGQEFFSCPVVFTVDGETHSCGSHAQGLAAWNWQPAHDRKASDNAEG